MSLFLDGLILFCIAFCVIAGVKNGFVRSVMGICKGAVALIVAYAYTPLIADRIRDSYLIGRIADGIAETLKSLAVNVEDRFAGGSVTYDLSKIASELPEAYTSILTRYHIDIPSFTAEIAPVTSADEGMITSVAEQIAAPCATALATAISFAGLFLAAFVGLSLVTWVLDALFHLPLLSAANRFFGFLFGALEAVLLAYVISMAGAAVVDAMGSISPGLFGPNVVANTVLCRFFVTHNLFDGLAALLSL